MTLGPTCRQPPVETPTLRTMPREPEVHKDVSEEPRSKRKARRKSGKKPIAAALQKIPDPLPVLKKPVVVPQVRRVTLRNRRGQLLTPSVLNEHGQPTTIRLLAHGRVEVFEDRITDYTRDLAAQGHLSIDLPR